MILIIVDAHIKCTDEHVESSATLTELRLTFAVISLLSTVLLDNESWSNSDEFYQFYPVDGTKHIVETLIENCCDYSRAPAL